MTSGIVRKRRLPDGTYGELESVFGGETSEQKVSRLEQENASLSLDLLIKDLRIDSIESVQAEMLLMILGGMANE